MMIVAITLLFKDIHTSNVRALPMICKNNYETHNMTVWAKKSYPLACYNAKTSRSASQLVFFLPSLPPSSFPAKLSQIENNFFITKFKNYNNNP